MKRGSKLMIMGALCVGLFYGAGRAADEEKTTLSDGSALSGGEGTLVGPVGEDQWFFKLEKEVTDGKAVAGAGTELKLLPSSGLERLIADANQNGSRSYRLWGRVTEYRGRNFIFPMQYLVLDGAPAEKAVETVGENPEEQAAAPAADANAVVNLPVEAMEKLRSRKVIRTEQLAVPLDIKQDSILADRMGFFSATADGRVFFALDSLGRNVPRVSLELLPSEALENAEEEQAQSPERERMKAAGVVTRYKGTYYLLLQRANRVYGHGNFGR